MVTNPGTKMKQIAVVVITLMANVRTMIHDIALHQVC